MSGPVPNLELRARVVDLRRQGCSIPEIQDRLGYHSYESVHYHLRRHGDKQLLQKISRRPKKRPERWARMAWLYRTGLSARDVGLLTGSSERAVHHVLVAFGEPLRYPGRGRRG